MKPGALFARWVAARPLTPRRGWLALAVAVAADGLQLALGPLGWLFADQAIDLVAMMLTTALLGFHVLLLPTFLLELIPLADALPTWTGCVLVVIALRRRQAAAPPPQPVATPPQLSPPALDSAATPHPVRETLQH